VSGAKYAIGTALDMARIPEPARSRMLAELPALLDQISPVAHLMLDVSEFTWVDDDRGELTTTLLTPAGDHIAGPFVMPLKGNPA
jgi:hypothetical protein